MTTAKTLRNLIKAFKDFEAAYVGVETVCRESKAISPGRSDVIMGQLLSMHIGFRQMLSEVERHAKEEEESA